MEAMDIRWQQRLQNYSRALALLNEAVRLVAKDMGYGRKTEDLLCEGLIQRFENTMKGLQI